MNASKVLPQPIYFPVWMRLEIDLKKYSKIKEQESKFDSKEQ